MAHLKSVNFLVVATTLPTLPFYIKLFQSVIKDYFRVDLHS